MGCSVLITETIVREFRFESEEEARSYIDTGDIWIYDSELIDSETLDVEVIPDPC